MLRSYTTDIPFRALSTRPFVHKNASCVLGSRTVIYGRNGSGKTTFSELLRRAASDAGDTEGATISGSIRVDNANATALLGSRDFNWAIHVYNRYYVLESLQLFLDGDRDSPSILKLGAPNIEAAEKLRSIRESAIVLGQRHQMVEATRKRLVAERDAAESKAKSDIISALSVSDPVLYNSTRFRIDRVRVLLQDSASKPLKDDEAAREIEVASAASLGPVKVPEVWPEVPASLRRTINEELLGLVVDSEPIAQLAENSALSDWVETGLAFHKAGDVCGFCQQGTVSETILLDYARHFSQALSALRMRLREAITYFEGVQVGIDNFLASLPREDELLVEHRIGLQSAKSPLADAASALRAQIDEAIAMLKERLADPLKPLPDNRRVTDDFVRLDTSELLVLLNANNQACDEQATRKKQAQSEVEAHFGASYGERYRHGLTRIALADHAMSTIRARED
jgi:wobble nucleotide-excising tRNase